MVRGVGRGLVVLVAAALAWCWALPLRPTPSPQPAGSSPQPAGLPPQPASRIVFEEPTMAVAVKPITPTLDTAYTVSGASEPLAAGLVAAWPLVSLAGGVSEDLTANNLDLTVSNGGGTLTVATDAAIGPYLDGLGADSYLYRADHALLDITGDLTMSVWVKDLPDATARLVYKSEVEMGESAYELVSQMDAPGVGLLSFWSGLPAGQFTSTGSYTLPEAGWVLLTLTHQEGLVTFYRNGVSLGTATTGSASLPNLASYLYVGGGGAPGFYAPVDLGDVRLWSRALGSAEVADLYANPWALYGADAGGGEPGGDPGGGGDPPASGPLGGSGGRTDRWRAVEPWVAGRVLLSVGGLGLEPNVAVRNYAVHAGGNLFDQSVPDGTARLQTVGVAADLELLHLLSGVDPTDADAARMFGAGAGIDVPLWHNHPDIDGELYLKAIDLGPWRPVRAGSHGGDLEDAYLIERSGLTPPPRHLNGAFLYGQRVPVTLSGGNHVGTMTPGETVEGGYWARHVYALKNTARGVDSVWLPLPEALIDASGNIVVAPPRLARRVPRSWGGAIDAVYVVMASTQPGTWATGLAVTAHDLWGNVVG